MTMKLTSFRVTNFRSVADSGWLDVDDVTALIGINESGKTNLLLPLWKLNPAKDGEIDTTADYPRKRFTEFRNLEEKPTFIEAMFDVGEQIAIRLSEMTGSAPSLLREVLVTRDFAGDRTVRFPAASTPRKTDKCRLIELLSDASNEIERSTPIKVEDDLRERLVEAINTARDMAMSVDGDALGASELDGIAHILTAVSLESAAKTSTAAPRFNRLGDDVTMIREELARPLPSETAGVADFILGELPKFVYYSNYGNLDSEIYLPHVIANMTRPDLGAKEAAKVRTLKVLFEFVGLSPQEILELGKDFRENGRRPTETELADIAEKKKQRSILLQSASTTLTERFREWWKQGNYRFRFEADGDHFRIWVSDEKRPEDIELEGRSTGLQWFLSFYLVFLVERGDAHADAILLLDEPGLSLHPLAQRDLSHFFDGLAPTNQLLYTTHSPFLVDADRLERVRKVFVGHDGTTRATADLRAADTDIVQRTAGYAVYAALNLTVAESLLLGCEVVIVEGPSDQYYLSAIKAVLTADGRLKTGRELVFPPSGGVRGVRPVASLLLGRDETLPTVFVDSDAAGKTFAQALKNGLYIGDRKRVLEVGDFVSLTNAEIEDLFPPDVIAREVDRLHRTADTPFMDVLVNGEAIVPQIERWAKDQRVDLQLGWKVDLAKRVKQVIVNTGPSAASNTIDLWDRLFARLLTPDQSEESAEA